MKENNITKDQINITYTKENITDNGYERRLRRISEKTYYGMKNTINKRDLYNYNLLGLVMKNQIFNELDPSTGISNSYLEITFGNKNIKVKSSEEYSNLHIILEKKNQMIFSLIKLVNQSNYDLKLKNKNISNIIIDLENNLFELFIDNDYSNLFRTQLDLISSQINNLNGNIFNELIHLINIVYDNYSLILQDVKDEKYNYFEIIRNITKKDYIAYIKNMINILEIFHNSTMLFLDNIEEEINNLTNIEKMDFLYDILDSIYDCKLILKEFNKYLFKSIEKGIMLFEIDIYDFIENLIGDLLYIIDYLSININKNEILIKSYNETERELLTFKLKKTREIIKIIFESLLLNVDSDYNIEMSMNNNQSIKFISDNKSKIFLNETEIKSNEIIKKIKTKISYIDLYDIYKENLDFINYIHNKSIIEFLENSYNVIVKKLINLEPEFLNKSNEIMVKKNNLFEISELIVNEINNEINDISSYIRKYVKEYKEQNIYNIHYNLYKINELFYEKEMKLLLDKFKKIFSETISMHKKRMDANYLLGFDYLNDLKYAICVSHKGETTFIGKGLYNKYSKFIKYYNQYIISIFSDDSKIFINLENNYRKIQNEIFNYLKAKLLSVNNYGFETNIYKDNFDFIKQMDTKILSIFEKINLYFTEERLSLIKSEILQLFVNQIQKYNEQKLNEFQSLYDYIFKFTKGLDKTKQDYEYRFKTWLGTKKRYRTLDRTTNNIYKINNDISHIINYVNQESSLVIQNFKNKVDKYLSNYIDYINNIYTKINLYLQEKIKNHNNINFLLNKYENIFNNLLNNDSNYGLLGKLYNVDLSEDIKYCIENLENNIKLLPDNYFTDYYLKNYKLFLEYPEEIQYKINYFDNIIKINIKSIKQKINKIYRNRIVNIIKSTNNFISNMIEIHKKYILINLNKNVIDEYLNSKLNYIFHYFNQFSTQFQNLSQDIYSINVQNDYLKIIGDENFIIFEENYDEPISSIFTGLQLFLDEFNLTINKDFNEEGCFENSDKYSSDFIYGNENSNKSNNIFCSIVMNKSDFKNYEYNYNIVKLRSGLNYTKNIIENIIAMTDGLKYDEIINILKFNDKEYLLNDNNILSIQNDTLYKLKEINENSIHLLDEQNEYLIEDILKKYKLSDDYYYFLKEFEKILKFENKNIKIYINNYINESIISIDLLLNNFNNTLYKLKNEYDFYNIKDIKVFKEILVNYYNLIENKFSINYEQIVKLKEKIYFKNLLRNYLSDLQNTKIIYFKKVINDLEKGYNFHLLNISLNLGEYFENYIKKSYEDLQFEYFFDYIGIYENYTNIYINRLTEYLNDYKNIILNEFSLIINEFIKDFYDGISTFVDYNYIIETKKNYSSCLGYSMDLLNETIEEDKINYNKYVNYTNLMEYIENNCTENKTKKIDNCLYNISEIEEIVYFNKTDYLLFCHKNSYFNYSIKIFENFEENDKNYLNNITNEILLIIEKNKLDMDFLNTFLENEFNLNSYNLSESDLLGDFEGYEDMIFFINYTYNSNYKDYLGELLKNNFKKSYINYINNFIVEFLNDNISIFINTKLDLYTKYLIEKISNEFNYYILLFNKTQELGIESINAFFKLYKTTIYKQIKFYYDTIEEDVLFYIDIFYRKNKYIFKENYINYYAKELNEFNIEIYGLKEYINEIISDNNFNKSLNNISNELMKEYVITKLNKTFINSYNNKIEQINLIIEEYDQKIKEILSTIDQSDDNLNIFKIIMNYQELLSNQNNKFNFKISNSPFEIINNFISNILEPPLLEIKNRYDIIEKTILDEMADSINNFPDYITILEGMLQINNIFNYIESIYDIIKDLLINYGNEFDIDSTSYINKLIHFTYINGLYTYNEPCIYSFCSINTEYNKINRNLEKNNINLSNRKLSTNEYRKYDDLYINNYIKSNGLDYNEEMGSLSKDDVIYTLRDTKNTISQLNLTLQINFDSKLKLKIQKYLNKINGTYLIKLKRTVSISALKFSTFLTKENYEKLESQLFKHYYTIENYIYNLSNYLVNNTYELIETIKKSSDYLQNVNDYSYDKILGIHDLFIKLIENKYTYISSEELKNYNNYLQKKINLKTAKKRNNNDIEKPNQIDTKILEEFQQKFGKIRNDNNFLCHQVFNIIYPKKEEILDAFKFDFLKKGDKNNGEKQDNFKIGVPITLSLKDIINNNNKYHPSKEFCKGKSFQYPIIIYLVSFPYLQLRIIPEFAVSACVEIGYEFETDKLSIKEGSALTLDLYLGAEASVSLEIGLYFPPFSMLNSFQISFAIGIKGMLGSGKIGMKLSIYLNGNKNNSKFIKYYEYQAIQLYVYILFKFECNLWIFSFSFQFYLINEKILGACSKCKGKGEIK